MTSLFAASLQTKRLLAKQTFLKQLKKPSEMSLVRLGRLLSCLDFLQCSLRKLKYMLTGGLLTNNCRTVDAIQRKVVKKGKRNVLSRVFQAKDDKDRIATWKQDLDRVLLTFNICSACCAWYLLTASF